MPALGLFSARLIPSLSLLLRCAIHTHHLMPHLRGMHPALKNDEIPN